LGLEVRGDDEPHLVAARGSEAGGAGPRVSATTSRIASRSRSLRSAQWSHRGDRGTHGDLDLRQIKTSSALSNAPDTAHSQHYQIRDERPNEADPDHHERLSIRSLRAIASAAPTL